MKTKCLIFTSLLLMNSVLSMKAQDVQLATLQQGEGLQVFYGADALKNALDAANNGDLITLSAGTFNAYLNITKAVKIQGAGYVTDAESGRYPSVLNGGITLQLPDGNEGLLIEGIKVNTINVDGNLSNAILRKCQLDGYLDLYYYNHDTHGHIINCIIDQCRIRASLMLDSESENLYIRNSIIQSLSPNTNQSSASILIENCIITQDATQDVPALFRNCIIGGVCNSNFCSTQNGSISSNSAAYNNVFLRGSNAKYSQVESGSIQSDSNTLFGKDIFSDYGDEGYNDNETYELTPNAKATFLGTDGTQVGIYGGDNPFSSVPTNPQVTQKNIATKSTLDGKLNVSIKVEAQNQ